MPDDNITITTAHGPVQENIPPHKRQRDRLRMIISRYVHDKRLAAPLSIEELRNHCSTILSTNDFDKKYTDYTAVLLNNEVWRETVNAIPYDKRLLLLPKCLRDAENCKGEFDEIGLICARCGRCLINEFQSQAEQLGYAVLIAEGSPVVMNLIESGKIEAVIGVSCLAVLENVFPYMEAGAIPGVAIPLLHDGCKNTFVDQDWVWEAIYETSDNILASFNLSSIRTNLDKCFSKGSLQKYLNADNDQVTAVALDWMLRAGKRYRPFLTAGLFKAFDKSDTFPEDLTRTCIAVECFHKASLIHDDIEDSDLTRYGQKTLHKEFSLPVALNTGDFLIGEGYRLLTELDVPPSCKTQMLKIASIGHRTLCIGQGAELAWRLKKNVLTPEQIIEIFADKTSPAFEVALKLGALLAGAYNTLTPILEKYSRALGIAYQIHDDLDDWYARKQDLQKVKLPSILFAIACQNAKGQNKNFLKSIWTGSIKIGDALGRIETVFTELNVEQRTWDLMQNYKSLAMTCLSKIDNTALKSLLRRLICKIFYDIEILECCDDYQARHARRRKKG